MKDEVKHGHIDILSHIVYLDKGKEARRCFLLADQIMSSQEWTNQIMIKEKVY